MAGGDSLCAQRGGARLVSRLGRRVDRRYDTHRNERTNAEHARVRIAAHARRPAEQGAHSPGVCCPAARSALPRACACARSRPLWRERAPAWSRVAHGDGSTGVFPTHHHSRHGTSRRAEVPSVIPPTRTHATAANATQDARAANPGPCANAARGCALADLERHPLL